MEPDEIARRASRIRLQNRQLAAAAKVNDNTVGRMFKGDRDCWRLTNLKVANALVAEEIALRDYLIGLHGLPPAPEKVPA